MRVGRPNLEVGGLTVLTSKLVVDHKLVIKHSVGAEYLHGRLDYMSSVLPSSLI